MSTIIHNVAVNPASARPWNWRGDLEAALGRGFRAEELRWALRIANEPQDLDFPLAPLSVLCAPWALSKWFCAV